ncbi:MAG TPA: hypothetical protein VF669_02145 [Tepidisphaeraceae bacterium]|jgi:predicted transcriptional regulator
MSSLTIEIPDEIRRELENISRQKQRPLEEVVRESLQKYVAVEQFRALRDSVLPAAKAAGFSTDDDVFKAIS